MDRPSKLRALVDKLLGPRHDYKEGIYSFEKLDIPRLRRELALEKMGAENGGANLPADVSEELDEIEHRITNRIQAERDEAHQRATDALATLSERIALTSLEGRATDIKVEVDGQIADFISTIARGENRLHLARRAILDAERGLTSFRAKNAIDRPAEYPESHWWAFAIVISAIAFEGILSAILLADAQENGISGAVGIALIISLVNVGIAFGVGRWGICGMLHRRFSIKLGAFLLCIGFLAALAACNLGAAHYRSALLGGNYKTPGSEAFQNLMNDTLGIRDLESWLLFAFGVVSAVAAGVKGYDWDDAYPGYGRRDRAYRRAARDYEDDMHDVMDQIDGIKNDAVSAAQTLKQRIDDLRGERGRVNAQRHRLLTNFHEHMKHLEGALGELMGLYRRANLATRSDKAPARFNRPVLFDRSSLTVSDELDARKSENEYARITSALEQAIERLLTEHVNALKRFKSIANLTYDEVASVVEPKVNAAE